MRTETDLNPKTEGSNLTKVQEAKDPDLHPDQSIKTKLDAEIVINICPIMHLIVLRDKDTTNIITQLKQKKCNHNTLKLIACGQL